MGITRYLRQMTNKLQDVFDGKGEVKGIKFTKLYYDGKCYIFERSDGNYEVFKVKTVPVCVDFEKQEYSTTDDKEIYPKSKDFGTWAWTFKNADDAFDRAKELGK